jgi:hypothetical protein
MTNHYVEIHDKHGSVADISSYNGEVILVAADEWTTVDLIFKPYQAMVLLQALKDAITICMSETEVSDDSVRS